MKKTFSLLIAAATVLVSLASLFPAHAISDIPVSYVDAPYFDVKPKIDGIVSEEEWGYASVFASQAYVGSSIVLTEEDDPDYNDYNTFFYRNPGAKSGYDAEKYNMSYTLWLRWDEDYFYIAAKVADPDGHSLKNGKRETWNGDALQFRLDPEGYNGVMGGFPDYYDAELDGKPWSSGDIDDICIGYVEAAGGFTEIWNNAEGGEGVGMTEFSGGDALAAVVPVGALYSFDSDTYTTYEAAIPWHYIDNYNHEYSDYSYRTPDGAIGREYGMSAVVYNADGTTGDAGYNAGLAWGSGIINAQQEFYLRTCGGSNLITLSGDVVSEDGYYCEGYETGDGYNAPEVPPSYPVRINSRYHVKLDYENESDMELLGADQNGERIEIKGNHVVRWDLDATSKTGYNEVNYLATANEETGALRYHTAGCAFTMEYDVKVTGTDLFETGYNSALYHWFGGARTYEYMCGYDFDRGQFIVEETLTEKILETYDADFTLNEWHHIVFQYYAPTSEIRYYFDPEMTDGRISPDAEPIFRMTYRYFDSPGLDECIVILRRMNCQILLDNVEYYNFVDYDNFDPTVEEPETFPGDADGDGIITLKDISALKAYFAGLDLFIVKENCDIDGNGIVNLLDISALKIMFAG
ncbi:MAG: hypothetical protein IKN38_04170 [Clostridia bacterium]|nr:hypothetical protein [Clostridia bacterium]